MRVCRCPHFHSRRSIGVGPGPVARVSARPDEIVERQVEGFPECMKTGGVALDQFRDRSARRIGSMDVLDAVLIGTGQEAYVVTGQPIKAGEGIGLHDL